MRLVLFLTMMTVPLVELALLIKLGQWIGFWPTLGLIIGTAILGSIVVHQQGLATLRRAMVLTERGTTSLEPTIDGMFLVFAGVLLITPGVITDLIGLVLWVPPLRRWVAHRMFSTLLRHATVDVHVSRHERVRQRSGWQRPDGNQDVNTGNTRPRQESGTIIEGEFERIDDPSPPRNDKGKT